MSKTEKFQAVIDDSIQYAKSVVPYKGKRRKINTWFQPSLEFGEVNNDPSMTVPDQTMTMTEIMNRYAKGLPLAGQKLPQYEDIEEGDDYLPDPRRMDLAERQELKEAAEKELENMKLKKKIREDNARKKREAEKTLKDDNHNKQPIGTQSANEKSTPNGGAASMP